MIQLLQLLSSLPWLLVGQNPTADPPPETEAGPMIIYDG